jgi:Sulfotransferase family
MRTARLWHVRRAVFLVRRSPPRVARPLSCVVHAGPPRRPVLIIGCPRSGTTALRTVLMASNELASVHAEGHILWDEFHPPCTRTATSDALGAQDVSERERQYVHLAVRLWTRRRRFLDKTPENCLRLDYLDALFPDAQFVFLHRRGADNVNSLMEAWRARPRFVTHRLSEPLEGIGPLDGSRWSLVLIPGWRELRHAPLETICAHQYVACNEAALAALARLDPARWVKVGYEQLCDQPVATIRSLFAALGLVFTPAVQEAATRLRETATATAITPPRRGKWSEQNRDAVQRILPLVAATERRLGYQPPQ